MVTLTIGMGVGGIGAFFGALVNIEGIRSDWLAACCIARAARAVGIAAIPSTIAQRCRLLIGKLCTQASSWEIGPDFCTRAETVGGSELVKWFGRLNGCPHC